MTAALAFLTCLGGATTPDGRTLRWFPAVGALIGLALGLVWAGSDAVWTPLVAATIVVAADLAITGLLHVDGLADSADGLLPPLDRDRRLAVMADPTTGAFGVATVGAVLLVRVACLATTPVTIVGLVTVWATARAAIAVVALVVPYARPDGLARAFLPDDAAAARTTAATLGAGTFAVAALVGAVAGGVSGLLAPVAVAVGAAAVTLLAVRRLDGFTGDVLGAACVVGETAGLLVLAAGAAP